MENKRTAYGMIAWMGLIFLLLSCGLDETQKKDCRDNLYEVGKAFCSERKAKTVQNEAVHEIVGSWNQISGFAIDSGCGLVREFEKNGAFYLRTWLSKDQNKVTIDSTSGTYLTKKAFVTTMKDGKEVITSRRYLLVSEYSGWDEKTGCSKGEGNGLVGTQSQAYIEFSQDLNADGSVTDSMNVYENATGGKPRSVFHRGEEATTE
ncbi:hypothetical protein WDW89_12190 [Deltaproteobacteria bacterium TL4]